MWPGSPWVHGGALGGAGWQRGGDPPPGGAQRPRGPVLSGHPGPPPHTLGLPQGARGSRAGAAAGRGGGQCR